MREQPARLEGRIADWRDDKGFGFISPAGGGEPVFLHIKAFTHRDKRPVGNEVVTYELTVDDRKRPRAAKVAFAHERQFARHTPGIGTRNASAPAGRIGIPLLIFICFMGLLVWLAFTRKLHGAVPGVYFVVSVATFLAYANDKARAEKRGSRRTPEINLHIFALLGGWPGALIAQRLFRHKSRKAEFQTAFWTTVVLNCIALAMFV